jgi:hypothetical protein
VSLTNPTSMVAVGLQLLNLWLLKVMQMHKQWCHDHKTWISDNRKRTSDMVRWVVFSMLPTSGRINVWRTPKEAYNPECLVRFQQWNTGHLLCWFVQQYRGTVFCWYHYYPSWPDYYKGVRGQVG